MKMPRLFREHIKRNVTSLDGEWRIKMDDDDVGIENKWFCALPDSEGATVPSVWNTKPGWLTYEGAVWYEKKFYFTGGTMRLLFEAVMTEATVWLDGSELGYHYGGFTAFDFTVYDVEEGYHTLTVRADNRFNDKSIPMATVDWYHYGGIIRSVSVEALRGLSILDCRFDYTLSDTLKNADCTPRLMLVNAENAPITEKVSVSLDSAKLLTEIITLEPREKREVTLPTVKLDNIELWDISSPRLYDLRIESESDDLCDRIGFRKIEVAKNEILLNGKSINILGVNRHEEHPDWGFAFPEGLMHRDIDLILELGCNTVRGSHYPNSKKFLDMLDERGILFWSEIPIWGGGFSEKALADCDVVERGLNMHREMISQYYNHPSIIIWGMHNEILSYTEAAYKMTEKYYAYLKENGGNRAVVYASDKPMTDICLTLTDIICLNLYFGWYYGFEPGAWDKFFLEFEERIKELGICDKPIIMSEFGYAGLYGCHDEEDIAWSEDYQAARLADALTSFKNQPRVKGSLVWQFADIRTTHKMGTNRARGFNNKGILNEYRKPKLAWRTVKEMYSSNK